MNRQSPSGPETSKRVRQLYTYGPASIPANTAAILTPANPAAFFIGPEIGDTVVVTENGPPTYGIVFAGSVAGSTPTGLVGVVANNITAAPILVPVGGFDLTVEVFFA